MLQGQLKWLDVDNAEMRSSGSRVVFEVARLCNQLLERFAWANRKAQPVRRLEIGNMRAVKRGGVHLREKLRIPFLVHPLASRWTGSFVSFT